MGKARTQAQKLRQKRGRPALPANVNSREPNGRLSRRQERQEYLEHETVSIAASARVRHLKLVDGDVSAIKQALDPMNGYVLGRLRMDGKLTERQHEAGIRYANDMARYYGLTGVQFPSARAQNLFAVRGSDGDDSDNRKEAALRARDRKIDLVKTLESCGDINTARKVQYTVNAVCVESLDHMRNLNPLMQEWLRKGLNKLADFYGV